MLNGRSPGAREQISAVKFPTRFPKLVMKLERIRTFVLVMLLSSLLTVTLISSSAIGNSSEFTAVTLISLYKEARADLLNTLDIYFNASTINTEVNATISVNVTSTTGNVTDTNAIGSSNASGGVETGYSNSFLCSNIYEVTLNYVKQADQYIEAAEANVKADNYNTAAQQALKALNILGKAYVHLMHCVETHKQPISNSSINATATNGHMAAGLISAILRHEIRLSRLKAALQAANNSGVNLSSAWDMVSQAQDLLSKAKDLAMEGNSSAAGNMMVEANRIMAQIVRTLRAGSVEAVEHGKWHARRDRGTNKGMNMSVNSTSKVAHAHHGQNHNKNATWKGSCIAGTEGESKGHKENPALKPTFTGRGNHSNGKGKMHEDMWGNGSKGGYKSSKGNNKTEADRYRSSTP